MLNNYFIIYLAFNNIEGRNYIIYSVKLCYKKKKGEKPQVFRHTLWLIKKN